MATKIFIIHGWTYTLDKWTPLNDLLRQKGFEPVLLQVPGLTAPSEKVWGIADYVDWLHEQLKDQTSPVVIGHSNGGRIALAYCQKYPTHFRHLVLIAAAGVAHTSLLHRLKLATLRILAQLGKPLARIKIVKKVFYKIIDARDYQQAPPNMRQTMQNMLAADADIDLTQIHLPTTLIWGNRDKSTPLSDAKVMQQKLPMSELHIIEGAAHSPHFSHTEQVANIITRTLNP